MTYEASRACHAGGTVVTTIIGLPEQNHRSQSVLLLLSRVSRPTRCDRIGSSPPGSSASAGISRQEYRRAAIAFSLESVSLE